jgi:chorismate lyase/3-hydroxybenzoate synthase
VELVGGGAARPLRLADGRASVVTAPDFSLISLVAPRCRGLAAPTFEAVVCRIYEELGRVLHGERRFPVRVWNFVPGINDPAGALDRYMVFNAGRHAGYSAWGQENLAHWLPAASAVGSPDDSLIVHCLAADVRGTPLENSRQTPAYRYSNRYGPRPPSFSRATVVSHGTSALLFVSGTASIRGEDSLHRGNLAGQLQVTLENLLHLWRAAQAKHEAVGPLSDARVYLPSRADHAFVVDALRRAFPSLARVETLRSALCRPELLVEIEAAAVRSCAAGTMRQVVA